MSTYSDFNSVTFQYSKLSNEDLKAYPTANALISTLMTVPAFPIGGQFSTLADVETLESTIKELGGFNAIFSADNFYQFKQFLFASRNINTTLKLDLVLRNFLLAQKYPLGQMFLTICTQDSTIRGIPNFESFRALCISTGVESAEFAIQELFNRFLLLGLNPNLPNLLLFKEQMDYTPLTYQLDFLSAPKFPLFNVGQLQLYGSDLNWFKVKSTTMNPCSEFPPLPTDPHGRYLHQFATALLPLAYTPFNKILENHKLSTISPISKDVNYNDFCSICIFGLLLKKYSEILYTTTRLKDLTASKLNAVISSQPPQLDSYISYLKSLESNILSGSTANYSNIFSVELF